MRQQRSHFTPEKDLVVEADGTTEVQPHEAADDPPIDCFYVYPTVSLDPGGNSDMTAGPEERNVIRAQFARFTSVSLSLIVTLGVSSQRS